MIHIAILIGDCTYEQLASAINDDHSQIGIIAASSQTEIKQRVTDRIALHPTEKWLILSGNTIAETQPNVRFRSA